MNISKQSLNDELSGLLAYNGNSDAVHAYRSAEHAVANGIPVAFPIHNAGVKSQAVKSYKAMHRSGRFERRFNIDLSKPLDVVWNPWIYILRSLKTSRGSTPPRSSITDTSYSSGEQWRDRDLFGG